MPHELTEDLIKCFKKYAVVTDKPPEGSFCVCKISLDTNEEQVEEYSLSFQVSSGDIDKVQEFAMAKYKKRIEPAKDLSEMFSNLAENIFVAMKFYQTTKLYFVDNSAYILPNKRIILGINGEIGCGKTTAVNRLTTRDQYQEYMFAEPLKKIAVVLGFENHQVFGSQEEKLEVNEFWGITGRQFLQVFGSEVCRDFVPKALPNMKFNGLTMWVRLFEKFIQTNTTDDIAVSDVRFADESETIKKYNGIVVRIVRPNYSTDNTTYDPTKHKSEQQADLIKPNVTILNDSTVESFHQKLDLLVEQVNRGVINSETTNLII